MYKSYQLAIITDGGIVTTRHYSLYDEEVTEVVADLWERLNGVENAEGLREAVAAFIKEREDMLADDDKVICDAAPKNISEIETFTSKLPDTDAILFDINGKWYADFAIIRNLTDRNFNIHGLLGSDKALCLYNGESVALYVGEFYAGSDKDIARRKLLTELGELKENLWDNDANKNYSALWQLCAEYDDDYNDLDLTDIIGEANFMDDSDLEEHFQNVILPDASLERIRYFIGDTYDDYIYRIDTYGNLQNAKKDDFIEVIDNVQDNLIDAIEPEKPYYPQSGSASGNAAHAGGSAM